MTTESDELLQALKDSEYYVTDLKHWHEYGVYTVKDLHRYELKAAFWDDYKSKHGFRPRSINFESWSDEKLQNEINALKQHEH